MTTNDTRTARERAENLALLSFPMVEKPNKKAFVRGFLARDAEPTTVTAEQIHGLRSDLALTKRERAEWESNAEEAQKQVDATHDALATMEGVTKTGRSEYTDGMEAVIKYIRRAIEEAGA